MNPSQYFTRKEIASANGLSVESIRRRERELGLDRCLDAACRKPIRYHRAGATAALTAAGMKVP
jgi:hypothetical protein